ncbi:hypothetical protein BDA96_02G232400 [Sorghum bicolor]|uniref:Uncharacterized protein n=2 Tax=Sorghum bicolor TaxID=4558 RepID=A0A921UTH2_SORBI|nr:hypothetical protein BDA96_02G232400 [Sorghum bicolor]KXG35746.1 hypothetical protein SORBI_3002G222000 [Sorghum bicolor]
MSSERLPRGVARPVAPTSCPQRGVASYPYHGEDCCPRRTSSSICGEKKQSEDDKWDPHKKEGKLDKIRKILDYTYRKTKVEKNENRIEGVSNPIKKPILVLIWIRDL